MIVQLLPNELNGLDSMTKKLSLKTLNQTVRTITKRKGFTNTLMFPKFKLETGINSEQYNTHTLYKLYIYILENCMLFNKINVMQ